MWYASCSVGPQLIPLTRPVPVVDVEPIGAPCSSGTPSKPTREAEDELLAAVEVGAVEVDVAVEVDGALEVAAGELVLVAVAEDVVELLPQAARVQAAIRARASPLTPLVRMRKPVDIGSATVARSAPGRR